MGGLSFGQMRAIGIERRRQALQNSDGAHQRIQHDMCPSHGRPRSACVPPDSMASGGGRHPYHQANCKCPPAAQCRVDEGAFGGHLVKPAVHCKTARHAGRKGNRRVPQNHHHTPDTHSLAVSFAPSLSGASASPHPHGSIRWGRVRCANPWCRVVWLLVARLRTHPSCRILCR